MTGELTKELFRVADTFGSRTQGQASTSAPHVDSGEMKYVQDLASGGDMIMTKGPREELHECTSCPEHRQSSRDSSTGTT